MVEPPALARPHLMLAHTRHDDRVVGTVVSQHVDRELRLQWPVLQLLVVERVALLPLAQLGPPRREIGPLPLLLRGLHRLQQLLDDEPAVADDRHVGPAHLAQLGGVDVDVNHLGTGRERVRLPGDAVIESRTERDQQVALLHRRDRGVVAVHAGHAQALRMVVGERAARHQRRDHRCAGRLRQRLERVGGAGLEDPAAGVDDRPVRLAPEPRRVLDLLRMALHVRLVTREVDGVGPVPIHHLVGDVLRHVHDHRPGSTGRRHVERLLHVPRDVLGIGHEPVVLGHRHRDPDRVALLERVGADDPVRHLPGDDDDRDRVHVGVTQSGDDVRGPGAARDHGHAGPAGRVGEPLGHVAGALLVADEDVADRRVDQRVVHGQDRPARQPEHDLGALHLEALDEGLGSCELHRRSSSSGEASWGVRGYEKPPAFARGGGAQTRLGRLRAR